jgi:hypothetical protein
MQAQPTHEKKHRPQLDEGGWASGGERRRDSGGRVQFDGWRGDNAATADHVFAYSGFGESGNRGGDYGVACRRQRHGQRNYGI